MDPGWMLLSLFMLIETLLVAVLIMPMPSNKIRGLMVDGIRHVWNTYPNLRYIAALMLTLNAYYFYNSMHYLYFSDRYEHSEIKDTKTRMFREQRNAYLTGFGIGLFFVLNRLMDLHTQLYDARNVQKEQEKKTQ
eukprot:TRINITY_DN7368_c0_g3_i1.p2 TRINITY_DN7368_c0_g3~~TRINITY_DN7368_c0_g3_i1.p2  ORF type:complete len:135 (+),score=68.64 TRINITY_DN7368_c0_g3_i1:82-486(+)